MAKVTKAYIRFKLNKDDADYTAIRFHSVVSEDHEVDNEVTKFPVQSGFNVSNHSIRKNRRVTLTGLITNTQMVSSDEFHEYSKNSNSKAAFDVLKDIVRQAVPCTVTTNLTEYDPVIFTKLKTKQEAGMTDAMSFTISGEEVQVATAINDTTPKKLIFKPVPDEERDARLAELREAGYNVSNEVTMSQAQVDLNESFSVGTTSLTGAASTMTYDKVNYDNTSSEFAYECSVSEDGTVADSGFVGPIAPEPTTGLANGAAVFGACLTDQVIDLVETEVSDFVTTAVGDLKKNIYGGLYEILGVNGDRTFGQRLLALGLDCFIVGATATRKTEIQPGDFDTDLPTADDALIGAAGVGDGLVTDTLGQSSPTTITKLSGSSTGTTSFLGDLL